MKLGILLTSLCASAPLFDLNPKSLVFFDSLSEATFPVSLNPSLYQTSTLITFTADFSYDRVILPSDFECLAQNHCSVVSEAKTGVFRKNTFYYVEVKLFIGIIELRNKEVTEEQASLASTFVAWHLRPDQDFDEAILGISPKSPIFEYWTSIYNFQNGLTFELFNHYYFNYMVFTNLKIDTEGVEIFVDDSKSQFEFSVDIHLPQPMMNSAFCISNELDVLFELEHSLFVSVMQNLCYDYFNCSVEKDLKPLPNREVLEFEYFNYKNEKNRKISFTANELYSITSDKRIKFNFISKPDASISKCVIEVHQKFFSLFSVKFNFNNLNKDHKFLLEINKIDPKSFFMIGRFSLLCILFSLLCLVVPCGYIAFSKVKVKKIIERKYQKNSLLYS